MRRSGVLLLVAVIVAAGSAAFWTQQGRDAADAVVGQIEEWSTELRDLADSLPDIEVEIRTVEEGSSSLLLVVGEGERSAYALLAAGPDAPPSLVVLPQEMLVSVPGFGEFRLVDAMVFDGPELVELAVTNQFGVRIDAVAALTPGTLAEAVHTEVAVDLAGGFLVDDGRSVGRQLPSGESLIRAALVEDLLVSRGTDGLFDWIQRQGAAWRGLLAAVSDEPRIADRMLVATAGPASADLLVTIAGDEESVVAAFPVARADTGTDRDALVPVADRVDSFIAGRLEHLLIKPEGRPRIEILNGNGRIGSTRAVAEILVRHGFRLVRTDNADSFDYAETLVIAQGVRSETAAREVADLLGKGLLFLEEQAPSGIVDVSIIVGSDVPTGEG